MIQCYNTVQAMNRSAINYVHILVVYIFRGIRGSEKAQSYAVLLGFCKIKYNDSLFHDFTEVSFSREF